MRDSEWCVIASKGFDGEPAFAIHHSVNQILHGFATQEDAERAAIARARAAYDEGEEAARVSVYLDGEHRTIWRASDPPPAPVVRTKRRRSR